MGIPALDTNGLLPPGIWDCTMQEVVANFSTNAHRANLLAGLMRFLAVEYTAKGLTPPPILIDGSFTRAKPLPEDVDVVLDLSALDDAQALHIALVIRLHHAAIKAEYHVDLWAKHPTLPNDLAAYFQYVGPKCAAELKLDERSPKGILRVQP